MKEKWKKPWRLLRSSERGGTPSNSHDEAPSSTHSDAASNRGSDAPSSSRYEPPTAEQDQLPPHFDSDEAGVGPKVLTSKSPLPDGPDIVFVHGLRGSRLGTWTSSDGKVCWPLDFLGKDIPNARIITWGYDSSIANFFKPASQESIFNHGDTLMSDLSQLRGETKRPIVFVCHSMGGLVVKQGLIRAASYHHNRVHGSIGAIWETTKGVVFMGTPHRGSGKEEFADIACKVATLTLRRPNKDLLSVLKEESHILDNQLQDFTTISSLMSIVCLREELSTHLIGMVSAFNIYGHANHLLLFHLTDANIFVTVSGSSQTFSLLHRHKRAVQLDSR